MGIEMFAEIRKYAVKNDIRIIFRTNDIAYKSGQLKEVEDELTKFVMEHNIDLEQLANNSQLIDELREKIKDKMDVKPDVIREEKGVKIIFSEEELKKIKKQQLKDKLLVKPKT